MNEKCVHSIHPHTWSLHMEAQKHSEWSSLYFNHMFKLPPLEPSLYSSPVPSIIAHSFSDCNPPQIKICDPPVTVDTLRGATVLTSFVVSILLLNFWRYLQRPAHNSLFHAPRRYKIMKGKILHTMYCPPPPRRPICSTIRMCTVEFLNIFVTAGTHYAAITDFSVPLFMNVDFKY